MSIRSVKARLLVAFALTLIGSCVRPTPANAESAAILKVDETTEIDAMGNATVKSMISAPTVVYTNIKTTNPNVNLLLRKFGIGRGWAVLENADAKFNDVKNRVEISYVVRGFARVEQGKRWSIAVAKEAALDLLEAHDRTAIFQGTVNSQAGVVNIIERIVVPAGSTNLKSNAQCSSFCYEFVPKVADGGRSDATFELDNKETIMGCLAKCYSNESFGNLWVGKCRFDNTGTSTLTDYRVRFRIAGFSDWSTWRHSSKVYPGQTVVDPFFPVLDLEKLGLLTGSRTASLECEYQYKKADGQAVIETDTKKLQLLGYNETIFSGLAPGEVTNFAEASEFIPLVIASFTSPSDPAVQQLVGRVSGLVPNGANNAAGTNDNAFAFAKTLYEWMVANRIAYQTPPVYVNGSTNGQHIKYARDVLRNHSGTCIDLAIFWASACESVNLQTALVLTKGHCFPVIRLPQGGTLAIEATGIAGHTFEEAVKYGTKEVEELKDRSDLATFVDVMAMRQGGVQPIDLPKVSDTFLTDLGYQFTVPKPAPVATPTAPATAPAKPDRSSAANDTKPSNEKSIVSQIAGNWTGSVRGPQGGTIRAGFNLLANGNMSYVIEAQFVNGETRKMQGSGQWKVSERSLVMTDQDGVTYFPFELKEQQLSVFIANLGVEINFVRS
ncbi:MAG TPA: hypothetical protein VFG04_19490 [Planctomycetaceae bacterium]|jgi:hypothetical protein|nr:hypothetical protein [Planctomycetaceae bacterium]